MQKMPPHKQLVAQMDASRYFDFEKMVYSDKEIAQVFQKGKAKIAIVFPPAFASGLLHFNKAQVQMIADAADPNTATTLTNYATAIIMDYQQRITQNAELPYTITIQQRMLYNPATARRLQFCARCNGNGADAGVYDDDRHYHRARKRNRHHGSDAGIAGAATQNYCGQSCALPVVIHYQHHQHIAA